MAPSPRHGLGDDHWRVVAGSRRLASAVLGAILTTTNASHRMNQAAAAANAYLEIQTAARQAREIDLPYSSVDEARRSWPSSPPGAMKQNKTAEPPGRRAYLRGRKNRTAAGQTYAVDASPDQSEIQ
ncbi:hypothetical protein CTZ40_00010 [Streptomyces rimosus]|nr:hypothetical protein CTZ40_00010 [Streptomyces rimosus]